MEYLSSESPRLWQFGLSRRLFVCDQLSHTTEFLKKITFNNFSSPSYISNSCANFQITTSFYLNFCKPRSLPEIIHSPRSMDYLSNSLHCVDASNPSRGGPEINDTKTKITSKLSTNSLTTKL